MAEKLNLFIDQGTDYSTVLDITNDYIGSINLASYTARAQMRKHYTSSKAYSFTTSSNANGMVTLSMNSQSTSIISGGRYVWDLEVVSGNTVSRIFEGLVTINPEVTR